VRPLLLEVELSRLSLFPSLLASAHAFLAFVCVACVAKTASRRAGRSSDVAADSSPGE